jgi:hypothetical protein
MEEQDKELVFQRIDDLYKLIKAQYENLKEKVDENISLSRTTNDRVTKLELKHEINIKEHKQLALTLGNVSKTMNIINDKSRACEQFNKDNLQEHEKINSTLNVIESKIEEAKSKDIKFWLNLSSNKWLIFMSIFVLFIFFRIVETKFGLVDFLVKVIFKI